MSEEDRKEVQQRFLDTLQGFVYRDDVVIEGQLFVREPDGGSVFLILRPDSWELQRGWPIPIGSPDASS